ncbi:MAG TPA: sugar transferase [Sulfurovum sp.]|jgi:undecaprenyl phosphate N,N'-diacetylbacillosamine 1-phosphate transferase|nr:MAG: lipid carrier--UDP-N-acetylgalactosaminyltransferase [Sulfurovum sp. 35-42-20]OYY56794.1 MAG: lipid carrier--UDP-N-acetylgalactosaminyltransferase [Sulfurovum sp. 28-43-6]OYZ26435.1 MAG: lipid carrier--UDP-N-acetylgalactosaminyltransferase [Sulfurovum sp. 16-42-52]OYZ48557.1 MAG: lipid carrier--UDP-N-acetylgalactosaminyltransferase [Sulfurovum sp. 24-42-9]OZA46363.1 MAG: lipid carrier--UDP-N-acetylgalactosaminyltransferase [Sulfurovum sp. 17-42-90]OZA60896.1 MAG: lipid carrier--UDP-N-a
MYTETIKPLADRLFAFLLLMVFAPVMLIVGVLIYMKMGKPVLFRQKRPGLHGKSFEILKFRTMENTCDSEGNLLSDEARLHGLGKTIRSLSLDELPQLFNVLRGEMSFVGPRPLLEEYLPLYNSEQAKRHDVKPGITGWAQVNGRNAISWEQKFAYDVWYVEHQSFALDMKILWMTGKNVLNRSDISSKTSVTMEPFKGTR